MKCLEENHLYIMNEYAPLMNSKQITLKSALQPFHINVALIPIYLGIHQLVQSFCHVLKLL